MNAVKIEMEEIVHGPCGIIAFIWTTTTRTSAFAGRLMGQHALQLRPRRTEG